MSGTLINCSNLHVGGGVQVATSFLHELSQMPDAAKQLSILASSEVDKNLDSVACERSCFAAYEVMDVFGMSLRKTSADHYMNEFDAVFTVFGPLYRLNPPFKSIVGFAQPWILYPQSLAWSFLPLIARFKSRLKFRLQTAFFKRADKLVVELEHVRNGLIAHTKIDPKKISVAYNCLADLYHTPSIWSEAPIPDISCNIKLGFLGRNYTHKNIALFAQTSEELAHQHGIKALLFVTFTQEEWEACPENLRAVCVNVGPLTVAQCPDFYQKMDAVFFPSLLECFSATPLEAMAMQRHVFASDMPFNRDVCHGFASFFSALDPCAAAASIADWYTGEETIDLMAAREHALAFSSPRKRTNQYLALLNDA